MKNARLRPPLTAVLLAAAGILAGCGVQRNFRIGSESSQPAPQPAAKASSSASPAPAKTSPGPKAEAPAESPAPKTGNESSAASTASATAPPASTPPAAPAATSTVSAEPPASIAVPTQAPTAASPAPSIQAFTLAAGPCSTVGRHLVIEIPNPERLDPSYRGKARGIEIRTSVRGGKAGVRHVRLKGGRLEFDAWTRGEGWIFSFAGSGSCQSGAAASASFDIIPHYR
jgi:hypothetical protein